MKNLNKDERNLFWSVTDKLSDEMESGLTFEEACNKCPFSNRCKLDNLAMSCACWEYEMGSDL